MVDPENYCEYRKELSWRHIVSDYNKPGLEWDALRRTWKPVDYTKMTVEELADRRANAENRQREIEAQIEGLLPASAAQNLLQRGSYGLYDLIIKLAKKAPETLLGAL